MSILWSVVVVVQAVNISPVVDLLVAGIVLLASDKSNLGSELVVAVVVAHVVLAQGMAPMVLGMSNLSAVVVVEIEQLVLDTHIRAVEVVRMTQQALDNHNHCAVEVHCIDIVQNFVLLKWLAQG